MKSLTELPAPARASAQAEARNLIAASDSGDHLGAVMSTIGMFVALAMGTPEFREIVDAAAAGDFAKVDALIRND
jgi:hypothetical protein